MFGGGERGAVVVVVPDGGHLPRQWLGRQDGGQTQHVMAGLQVLVVHGRVAQEPEVVRMLRAQPLGGVEAVDKECLTARSVMAQALEHLRSDHARSNPPFPTQDTRSFI